jgi:hypothetical protein
MHDLKAQKWLTKHNCVKQDLSLQTEAGIDVVIISRKSKTKTVNFGETLKCRGLQRKNTVHQCCQ